MDRRKYVNFNTLHEVRLRFFEKFEENYIHLHCTVGNHDTFYRNTNEINSLKELFDDKKEYFHLYENPIALDFDGTLYFTTSNGWLYAVGDQETIDSERHVAMKERNDYLSEINESDWWVVPFLIFVIIFMVVCIVVWIYTHFFFFWDN